VEYRNLGATGLKISRLVFGGHHIGNILDEAGTRRLVQAGWDLGITTYYTADVYSDGAAESILGKVLKERRHDVVIMTKLGHRVGAPIAEHLAFRGAPADDADLLHRGVLPTSYGMSRRHLIDALEASLRRLQTDYVDVCSVHYWDLQTPIEETLETLNGFINDGKVRYIGCSNYAAWQLYRALCVSEVRHLAPMRAFQTEYNLFNRLPEREQLPACQAAGVGILVFNSLCGNLLTGRNPELLGKMAGPMRQRHLDEYVTEDNLARVQQLTRLSEDTGREPASLAQGWVLSHDAVTGLLIGPNEPEEFGPMVDAVVHPLESDELTRLEKIALPPPPSGTSRWPR
jgi:1-deoxyxylulose-5-phosphate synthase